VSRAFAFALVFSVLAAPAAAAGVPDVHVDAAWAPSPRFTKVATLTLTRVPAKARVELLCRGAGCAFTRKVVAMHGSSRVALARSFRGARLRAGAAVQIRVTVPNIGVVLVRFVMRSGRAPRKERSFIALSAGPAPPPTPAPAPPPPAPGGAPPPGQPPAQPKAQQALAVAQQYLGTPFVYGGASPATGFDDDGLVQYAYGQVGVQLPRVAADQFNVGVPVALADVRPGDLVFFQDPTAYVDHVGIYAGGEQFLHAPHTGDVIKYSSLSEPGYAQRFAGARRVAD
jgi:cell wall-associated NlpC family hydrolase